MKKTILALLIGLILLAGCAPAPQARPSNPESIPATDSPGSIQPTAEPTSTGPLSADTGSITASGFTLTSPDLPDDHRLPAEYTCDGAASTLALAWSGAPADTKSFAVVMHHVAPDNVIHWYWVLYDIPADVTSLLKNVTGIGKLGNNFNTGKEGYAPPCSQGPGDKEYIYTLYALSGEPQISLPAEQISRAVFLDAIKDMTLASAELHVVYARP